MSLSERAKNALTDFGIYVVVGLGAVGIFLAANNSHRKTLHLLALVDQARIVAEEYPNNDEVMKLAEFAERAASDLNLDRYED